MIYAGKQITGAADKLVKVPIEYVFHKLIRPDNDIQTKIRQLRIVRDIDKKTYGQLKKELPYLVCGTFNPPFRKIENFAYIEYFFIDIDHISQKGLDITSVRKALQDDSRTILLFSSPGEDGIKVLFHLREKCYDPGIYSLFYKTFIRQLSKDKGIEQVVDEKTSDVCRACFMSSDENAYYNPNADSIAIESYIDTSNPVSMYDLKKEIEHDYNNKIIINKTQDNNYNDPDKTSIEIIKNILKLHSKRQNHPKIFVPEQLNEIIIDLRKYIEQTGIQVTNIININYGKKIQMKLGLKLSEINLFYGKRGFTVVKSPRTGTDFEMNDISAELINSFFNQY